MMPNDGIPMLQYYNNIEIMDGSDRKKAIAALKLLMAKFRDVPGVRNKFSDIKEPLPDELPQILKFLAIICKQLTSLKNKNSEPSKTVISAKQLCMIARILRQILHAQQVSDYRALGLDDRATQEQIDNHYRWLNSLFAFDESIDPQRRSIRRVMQAYITLRNLRFCNEEDILPSVLMSAQELNFDLAPIANEKIVASARVHETPQRKGLGITNSILVFLTVSSGVGWWWLLTGHDVEEVAKITPSKEISQPKNGAQKPQQMAIIEEKTNEPDSISGKQSNSPKKTNIERSQQQAIKLTVTPTQPSRKVLQPEIKAIKPSVSTARVNNPNKKSFENSAIIAIRKKENQTTTPEKESIKTEKTQSKIELAVNSANNWKQRNTTNTAQGDNLVIELAVSSVNDWKQRNITKPVQNNANLVNLPSEEKAPFIIP